MSNFEAFDKKYLAQIIDPFLPGAVDHITPIMYRAYTPDIFMFLFRAFIEGAGDNYFVSFQYDFIKDMDSITNIVEEWTGDKPIQAIATSASDETDDRQFIVETDNGYKCVLLMVPKPKDLGYWSDHIVINRGDDIDALLSDYTKKERGIVKKLLEKGTESRSIAVYRLDGEMELFYSV